MTLDELDKLAAEKVMGWHLVNTAWCEARHDISGGKETFFSDWYWMPQLHWQPTRNIAQAWECLEKMGNPFHMSYLPFRGKDVYSLTLLLLDRDVIEVGPTFSEAIVRACLKAKGVKI